MTRFEKVTVKGSGYFQAKPFPMQILQHSQTQSHFTPTCLWRWNRQSVPKCRHIKFRCQWITQKKAHNGRLRHSVPSVKFLYGSCDFVCLQVWSRGWMLYVVQWWWQQWMGALCIISTIHFTTFPCLHYLCW